MRNVNDPQAWRTGPGRLLADARNALGWSKRQAAREAGFSEAMWRQLEEGERQVTQDVKVPVNPRDDTLLAAARAVGLEPAVVFAAAGRPYNAPPDLAAMDASGVDFEELRSVDPETYASVAQIARVAIDRARRRDD